MRDKPCELIHIDIWGPFSVPIIDGYKYFVYYCIVDDFSQGTWTYLLRQNLMFYMFFLDSLR